MMIYLMILILFLLTAVYCFIEYLDNRYYKETFEVERNISFFSKMRMDLIKMVHLGEIEVNSYYFKYMYSASSYSIRALYFYKTKSKALENINILKNMSPYLLNNNFAEELKTLNNEQKRLFYETITRVLMIYLSTHYIEKLIFKICFQQTVKLFKNLDAAKWFQFVSKETRSGVDYSRQLQNFSTACCA